MSQMNAEPLYACGIVLAHEQRDSGAHAWAVAWRWRMECRVVRVASRMDGDVGLFVCYLR